MANFLLAHGIKVKSYAEIGIAKGETVLEVCKVLEPNSSIYLFDYESNVKEVSERIESQFPGKFKIYKFPNSRQMRDSYCWNLLQIIKIQKLNNPVFDYVYLDGSHDLTIDGFTFYLVDILLKKGGVIEFDDYNWTFLKSPTVNPTRCPIVAENYTAEQIATPHIKLLIDNLVKPNRNYKEIVKNRVYKKVY